MLNYNVSANDPASTSFTQHRLRSFKYKIFSDELLTLSRMRRRRPDVYPDEVCRSCLMSTESQSYFWKCPSHQDEWHAILNRAAGQLLQLLQKNKVKKLPLIEQITQRLHESSTFIPTGIISNTFYNFVHDAVRSSSTTDIIVSNVYNYIYRQIFTHVWKPRCAKVVAYERSLGITNQNKRSKHRSTMFNYPPNANVQQDDEPDLSVPSWVDWYTSSIRNGQTWLSHLFTSQADMFISYITSALNF